MPGVKGRSGRTHTLKDPVKLRELEQLCRLQCTYAEIAAFFAVDVATVERWAARPRYRTVMERGKQTGLISLRRAQFTSAVGDPEKGIAGNVTAQIWLGKQLLGQKDQVNNAGSIDIGFTGSAVDVLISRVRSLSSPAPADAGTGQPDGGSGEGPAL